MDPREAVYQLYTASAIQRLEAIGIQIPAALLAAAGLSSLILAATGTFGVLSLAGRRRTREIGIRQALGANRKTIILSMLRSGLSRIFIASAAGLTLSIACVRLLSAMFGAFEYETLIYSAVFAVMIGIGFIATLAPALEASAMPPLDAIRDI